MATFIIGGTTVTFTATIQSSSQEAGDVERLTIRALFNDATEWADAVTLLTTKYHIHVPMDGDVVFDFVRGGGAGALVISGLGTTTAYLVGLQRIQYLPNSRSLATASFLRTAAWS